MTSWRKVTTYAVMFIVAAFVGAACTDDSGRPSAAPSSNAQNLGTTSTTFGMLDPNTPRTSKSGSPEAQSIVDNTRGLLAIDDSAAACLAQRLDADPDLRAALGSDRQNSTRWQSYNDLAVECVRVTTGATNWANGIQAQANGTLTIDTLNCLRDAYAKLSADDTGSFIRAGLNPGTVDPNATQILVDLLNDCGVDPAKLPQPKPS